MAFPCQHHSNHACSSEIAFSMWPPTPLMLHSHKIYGKRCFNLAFFKCEHVCLKTFGRREVDWQRNRLSGVDCDYLNYCLLLRLIVIWTTEEQWSMPSQGSSIKQKSGKSLSVLWVKQVALCRLPNEHFKVFHSNQYSIRSHLSATLGGFLPNRHFIRYSLILLKPSNRVLNRF